MFHHIAAPVVFNEHLTGEYWLMEVEAPDIASRLVPGQFVNIRIEDSLSPFLRRPFSVFRISEDRRRLQVAYKIIGSGTQLMSTTMPAGGNCDVIGPFGRGFDLPDGARRIAVVGRGIGIAALPTLVDAARAREIEVDAFLSARNAANLVGLDIFAEGGNRVFAHTDEERGVPLVTDHLLPLANEIQYDAFYVCGSNRLIRAVDTLASSLGKPAQAAMEQHMACGFGDCHGCVIEVNLDKHRQSQGYREVCHHGPVFDTWEVSHA